MLATYEYLDRIQRHDSPEAIKRTLQEATANLGFNGFVYLVLRQPAAGPTQRDLFTYPRAWLDRYLGRGYEFVDVVLATASSTTVPYRWDKLRTWPGISKRQDRIFDEAAEFGIRNGITIPLHGPRAGVAALSLSSNLPAKEFNEVWRTKRLEFTVIASYAHEAMVQSVRKHAQHTPILLTDRERECLLWTARGKTSWEVGEILDISEETVICHFKRAMRKLGVFSKHHAVVKAILHGLIMP